MKFKPFAEARRFVQSLGLKSELQWREYCKAGKRPHDIPYHPDRAYENEWRGMQDWLGTHNTVSPKGKFRPFNEARQFAHSLGLKSFEEWKDYCKSGKKPFDIPIYPDAVSSYKKWWKGWKDWLGYDGALSRLRPYLSFDDARVHAHSMKFKNRDDWLAYVKTGKKPANIPADPSRRYKEWKGWGDWLGTGTRAPQDRQFRPFNEARQFVRALEIGSISKWIEYCKSGNKPKDIPSNPDKYYEKDWKTWGDWLGTGRIADQDKVFRIFEDARKYIHSLGIKNQAEWNRYCRSGRKPQDIPADPPSAYKEEWKTWGDWLGTGYIATSNRVYRPFEEARAFVHALRLKDSEDWSNYVKSGQKPEDIPASPSSYGTEFKGMGDWLGTGVISTHDRLHRPFEEAREFVRTLGLKNREEWTNYCKSGKKPQDLPYTPDKAYGNKWTWWADWLGYKEEHWSVRKVKELLKHLIDSKVIYQWDEAVLYSFLLRRGLLHLHNSRHEIFFKNLIAASRIEEGSKAIEEYVNSDSQTPPDLSELTSIPKETSRNLLEDKDEVESASPQELSRLIGNTDPLDYGEIKTVEQILAQTNVLESINVDEEAMQFYVDYSIDELWKSAFRDKENAILYVKREGKNGNKYHDTVLDSFLSDYEGTQNIQIPRGYTFPYQPTLMQLYVAYKVKTNQYFGNFSGTGAGKTLSAVLASRVIDSKMTLIVCPNDVVEQWKKSILEIFPDSIVTTGKKHFIKNMMKVNINTLF